MRRGRSGGVLSSSETGGVHVSVTVKGVFTEEARKARKRVEMLRNSRCQAQILTSNLTFPVTVHHLISFLTLPSPQDPF